MSAVPAPRVAMLPLAESELGALMAIERDLYAFPWTLGNFRDSLRAGYSCWGLWRDGELIGYAVMMLGPDEAHLLNLSVAAAYQRRGHASVMLHSLFATARAHGARRLFLEVRPTNAPARALYRRFGFEQVGTRRGYYPDQQGREDAMVLAIEL
ncbi:MAG: ribosomal protein S18-alanine N-acetyltransferase [Burkholderiales bacterium]|jgi:ribosomal-protein-alanine N-acetyltransferase|nr:ribosomal protein S18-alanine N-acetyltransferase [Burkholderiales bacterium]